MRRLKTLIICLLMLVIGSIDIINVNALEILSSEIKASSCEVKKGEKLDILFSFKTDKAKNQDITAFQAILDYDKNIFEDVNQSDFKTFGTWQEFMYNSKNNKFVAINKSGKINGDTVLSITMKAKQNLKNVKTSIKIRDIVASNGEKDINLNDSEVQIDVLSANNQTNDVSVNNNSINNTSGNSIGNTSETNNSGNTNLQMSDNNKLDKYDNKLETDNKKNNQDSTQNIHTENKKEKNISQKIINKRYTSLAVKIFLCLIILIIIVYIMKKKLEDKDGRISLTGKIMIVSVIIFIILAQVMVITNAKGRAGDINEDGRINYDDIILLEKHLIDINKLTENGLLKADINYDNNVTVTDLALLVKKIEENINYKVEILSGLSNYYPKKNEEIDLKFSANISHDATIEQVTINNKEYRVHKIPGTNDYFIKINVGNESGIQEFKFSKVKLNVGKEVKVDFNEKIDVLKDKPTIENYKVLELPKDHKVKVSFELKDTDMSVTSSKMNIIEKDASKVNKEYKINAGKNEFDLELDENKDYVLEFDVNYDLDTNNLVEHEKDNSGKISDRYDLRLNIDYNFKFTDLKVLNSDGEETKLFNKNQPIIINFKSTNSTKFKPTRVKVNDKYYKLKEKDNNIYLANLDGSKKAGKYKITVQEIVLSNGKTFDIDKQNSIIVDINKQSPEVKNFIIKEKDNGESLEISFKICDEDESISRKKLYIKNDNGKVIFEKEFEKLDFNEKCNLDDNLSSKYTVEIEADYDLTTDNTNPLKNQIIYSKTINAKPRVRVLKSQISNEKVEKNDEITITYTLESNKDTDIKQMLINNVLATVNKKADNIYEVRISSGNDAGILELNLTKVIFSDDTEVEVNNVNQIEVLKSVPKINQFSIKENFDDGIVNFNFNVEDSDKSFISGKLELVKNDGSIHYKGDITKTGEQQFKSSVVEDEVYTLKITIKYAKDESRDLIDDVVVLEKPVQLVRDYNLNISEISTYNEEKTKYFNKNESIKVGFNITDTTSFDPEKVEINGQIYDLTNLGNNKYEVVINGFTSAGIKDITIEKVIMNNEKELVVSNDNNVKVDILKSSPQVNNFNYELLNNDNINLSFNILDSEDSIINSKIIIDDGNKEIYKKENLKIGENTVEFRPNSSESYNAKIVANYDLDSNKLDDESNFYENQVLLEKNIVISQELIELKDIESVILYKKEGDSVTKVTDLDTKSFKPQDYIAQVVMKDMPTFYAEILSGDIVNGKFMLDLKYNNGVSYIKDQMYNGIRVPYGKVQDGSVKDVTLESIVNIIKENPNAEIVLNSDLDASKYNSSESAIIFKEFQGKFDGNGHTIKNLNKPLFNSTNGATIENLILDGAQISNTKGILSNDISNTKIKNVHIKNSNLKANRTDGTGIIAGTSRGNTKIIESSISNINIKGDKRTGGVIGFAYDNFLIENSYIEGNVSTTSDAAGGIIGQVSGTSTLKNVYVDISFNVNGDWAHGGMIGYSKGAKVNLENSISLADGEHGKRIIGNGSIRAVNSYELSESNLVRNNINGISEISKNNINESFFEDTLRWNPDIWSLKNRNADDMPKLNNLDLNYYEEANKPVVTPENKDVYIPDIERLRNLSNYDVNKEIAYHNMYKLNPFYDAKLYLEYGNKISNDNLLNRQKIKIIIPYDNNGNAIIGLNSENYNNISKIKIIFDNEEFLSYKVNFNKLLNDIATYKINELGIPYTYNKFVLNKNISLVNEILEKARQLNYEGDIASLTSENESRLYTDYYNEVVSKKIDDVILKILASESQYNIYLDNDILKAKISNDLFNNSKLEKILYSYNYFDKWYNISMGGTTITDMIFISSNDLNKNTGIDDLVNKTMIQSSDARNTNNTVGFFNNVIKPILENRDLSASLEYFIKILENQNNPSDWFKDNFNGVLREVPIKGKENIVRYRAWELLKARNNHLLPILTAPQEDMYIISVPSQILLGSLNAYPSYVNGNKDAIMKAFNLYAERVGNFYTTSSSFINNSTDILNRRVHMQYDSRFNFPKTGDQNRGTTQDPVIKWVYEALGIFANKNGSGAYANGTDVYWVASKQLDNSSNEWNYYLFSHESAHNIDGYYFYEGNGRRSGTDGEDHADGNISYNRQYGETITFNLGENQRLTDDVQNNFKMKRIEGKENINGYYREMFETYYVLDYLTAKAFLGLTPDQQSKLATQVSYEGVSNPEQGGRTTIYSKLSAEEFEKMNLTSIEDLWNNRIVFRNPGKVPGNGQYGYDSAYNIYWYQPHNDNGRPDNYTFKRLGFEMLGVGGYQDGYVIYRSTRSKNDLDALRKITQNENATWESYKLGRFKHVEQNLNSIPYFNTDEIIEVYKDAMIKDANAGNKNNTNNIRRVLYGVVKRATKDFTTGTIYGANTINISTAEQLISEIKNNEWGDYKLVSDLDFSNIQPENGVYIDKEFIGRIDGNGHKIIGLKQPLFNKITYSELQDINIESPKFSENAQAILAKTSKNSIINNINATSMNLNVPFIRNKEGVLITLGKNEVEVKNNEIRTVEDLIAITNAEDPLASKMSYELMNDIDVSSITQTNTIIPNTFEGEINGNGYKIYNLNRPLFNILKGKVSNLTIENASIGSDGVSSVGAIAKETINASVQNIKLNNINVTGRDNVASVVGVSRGTTFNKVSANNIIVRGNHFYAGGFIGRSFDTKISDVMIKGRLEIADTHNGGLIGAMNRDTIERAYVDVDVTKFRNGDNRNKNAGLYGAIEYGPIKVKDVVVKGSVPEALFKIAPAENPTEIGDIGKYLINVYEYDSSTGKSNIADSNSIKVVDDAMLKDMSFYTTTLGWSNEIWDLSGVPYGEAPKIK